MSANPDDQAATTPPAPTVSNAPGDGNVPWDQVLARFPAGSLAATGSLPVPALALDFRMQVELEPKISLGRGVWGERNWIGFRGGAWSAGWGGGTVAAGGQDAQLVVAGSGAAFLDTRYLLATADAEPAHIMVRTQGWRTGPPAVLRRLLDPARADAVPPDAYRFRLSIRLETGDPRYAWVNEAMWVGSGIRRGSEVIYDAYRLL